MTLSFDHVISDVVNRAYILPAEDEEEESDRRNLAESMLRLAIDCLEIGMGEDEIDTIFRSANDIIIEDQGVAPDSFRAETMTAVDQRMRPLCVDAIRILAKIP